MKFRLLIFLVGLTALIGCSQASYTTVEYNPGTGAYEEVKYTRFFEGEEILIANKVKALGFVTLQNKYGKKAVQKEDNPWESAEFKIYFSNISLGNVNFRINSILFKNNFFSDRILNEPQEFIIGSKGVERIIAEDRRVVNSDLGFTLVIDYTDAKGNHKKEIALKRLSKKDLQER